MELYYKGNDNLILNNEEKKRLEQIYYFSGNGRDLYEEQRSFVELFYPLLKDNNINPEEWSITFESRGRLICMKLLSQLITDNETVLITSTNEHTCLYTFINTHPNVNVAYFNVDESVENMINNINNQIEGKNFKKAVVWGIGTCIEDGKKITDETYKKIKLNLLKKNLETIMIVDDCQAMFLTNRDYNIFDFVLGTGHVVYKNFSMGMLLYKKKYKLNFGLTNYDLVKTYIDNLNIILKRRNDLLTFAPIMANNEQIQEYLKKYGLKIYTGEGSQTNIFTFGKEFPNVEVDEELQNKLQKFFEEMKTHHIHMEGIERQISSIKQQSPIRRVQIRLRSQDFLISKDIKKIDEFIFKNKALTTNSLLIE